MKKLLRYSLTLVLALVANLTLMAAEPYKVLTFPDDNKESNSVSAYDKTWEAMIGTDVWTITGFNNNKWEKNWKWIKCGSKNFASDASITSPAFEEAIEYMVVTIDNITAKSVKTIKAEFGANEVNIDSKNFKAGELIIKNETPEAGKTCKLAISCDKGSANGLVTISKIAYYKKGDKPVSVDISNTPETAYSVAKAIELVNAGEGLATQVYVKGIVTEAPTSLNEKYGSLTYTISDNSEATNKFVVYSGLNINGEKFTSADQIKVGDEVVVYGTMKKFGETYEFNYNNVLISLNRVETGITNITTSAADNAPIFNLAGQKVGKGYKGVVIKAGKKMIQ